MDPTPTPPIQIEDSIAARIERVRVRIVAAATRSGRRADEVRLVAVSKTFPLDCVREAAAAGHADFGENKVQEGLDKVAASPDLPVRWHLIGHLQSNKAKRAAVGFACIQSIDSVSLLERVDAAAAAAGAAPDVLVQVDLAGEDTKFGAPPDEAWRIIQAAERCRAARLVGLMLLPPWSEDGEVTRPYFARTRDLRDEWLRAGANPAALRQLSMGMSHDFEVAIEEGATIVRVGTAIFGKRTKPTLAGQ